MQGGSIGNSSLRKDGFEFLMGEKRYLSDMQASKVNFSNDMESFDGLSAIDGLGSLGNMSSDDDGIFMTMIAFLLEFLPYCFDADELIYDKRTKFDDEDLDDVDADSKAQANLDRRRYKLVWSYQEFFDHLTKLTVY